MLNDAIAKRIYGNKYNAVKLNEFSRKSGITQETLSQILKGATKNPGVYTIAKIADVLDCAVDELIADDGNTTKKTALKIQLARSCIITTVDLLHQEKQKIDLDEFLLILSEIYVHSLDKKTKTVDTKFATQYIKNLVNGKNVKG